MSFTLADCRVAVVGLGLIGASLCADLTRLKVCREVRGVSRSSSTVARGIAEGIIDQGTTRLQTGVQGVDIVILASPVRIAIGQLERISGHLKEGAIVADVGSTSVEVVEAMERLPAHVQPIATHPMAGKETSGFDSAERGLFDNATWILTPLERTSSRTVDVFRELVVAVGAHPLMMEPHKHDRVVAAISHVPFLLSSALVGSVVRAGEQDPEVWECAAGGFRDTSRVAASEAGMFIDILMTNRENVHRQLDRFIDEIRELRSMLVERQEDELVVRLSSNRDARLAWYAAWMERNRPEI